MIHRWDIVTIGNLSRNRYWGEPDDRAMRTALCTCTLVETAAGRLLVDPSIANPEQMASELNRRTGLLPASITAVFVTHAHGDHHAGLECFPNAEWLTAPGVAEAINQTGKYRKRLMPAAVRILEEIDLVATPGHTPDHHSLRFDWNRYSVVIAGDAVMTQDFWRNRQGYFNSADFQTVGETMDHLVSIADMVVPGHDNYFLTQAGQRP